MTIIFSREARRTLPRPKVGDFCSTAMEQGFSDACVALCMEQPPVGRVAQTCRSAAIEMPRPTVRRWCEHGYNVAFQKTIKDLTEYFKPQPVKTEDSRVASEEARGNADQKKDLQEEANNNAYKEQADTRSIIATIPVTLDDAETKNLTVREGQNAEEAVVEFCRENVPNEVGTCIRQLLSVVIEKLADLSVNA